MRAWLVRILLLAGSALVSSAAWIPLKAFAAQALLEQAWSSSSDGTAHRPWRWADMYPIARLRIDRLGLDTIVVSGTTGRSLAFAPGHVAGTAIPGRRGVSIIAAHRDTHFLRLRDVQAGDVVEVTVSGGAVVRYTVAETVVTEDDRMPRFTATDLLVLSTCYPFDAVSPGGAQRFLVLAVKQGRRLEASGAAAGAFQAAAFISPQSRRIAPHRLRRSVVIRPPIEVRPGEAGGRS